MAMMAAMAASMALPAATPAATAATSQAGSRIPLQNRPSIGQSSAATPHSSAAEPHGGQPWSQASEIAGSSGGGFASGVAINGNTMVVGAPYDNSGIGAAYVYTGSGTSWTQEATLTPSDGVCR